MRNVNIKDVEKALGFSLNDEQMEVLDASVWELIRMNAPKERCTGSTTAAALRVLLSQGNNTVELCCPQTDNKNNTPADHMLLLACSNYSDDTDRRKYKVFCREIIELGQRLTEAGIDVRECSYGKSSTKLSINHACKKPFVYEAKLDLDTSEADEKLNKLTQDIERLNKAAEEMRDKLCEGLEKMCALAELAADKINESSYFIGENDDP